MRPGDLLVKRSGEWFCKECSHPFGDQKAFAETVVRVHARNHGIGGYERPRASSPGGGGGTSAGGGPGLLDTALDIIFGD